MLVDLHGSDLLRKTARSSGAAFSAAQLTEGQADRIQTSNATSSVNQTKYNSIMKMPKNSLFNRLSNDVGIISFYRVAQVTPKYAYSIYVQALMFRMDGHSLIASLSSPAVCIWLMS